MGKFVIIISFIIVFLFQSLWAQNVEIVLQNGLDGYSGCEDTHIESENPQKNFSSSEWLKLYAESENNTGTLNEKEKRTNILLKFDLSDISPSIKIISATLQLYVDGTKKIKNNPEQGIKALYKITEDWKSSKVTWENAPDIFSLHLFANNNSLNKVWEKYDVTSLIKSIVNDGAENKGFMLKFSINHETLKYKSSENTKAEERPKLVITCEETGIPTVSILNPVTNQSLKHGSTFKIGWKANDNNDVVGVSIYLNTDAKQWELIDSVEAGNGEGTYDWTVPDNVLSSRCKLKINAYDAEGNVGIKTSCIFAIGVPIPIIHQIQTNSLTGPGNFYGGITLFNIQGRVIGSSYGIKNNQMINLQGNSPGAGFYIINYATPQKRMSRSIIKSR